MSKEILDNDLVEIIIIDAEFPYSDIDVFGIPLKEHIIRELAHLEPQVVSKKAEARTPKSKYTVVLYTYMPLVTDKTIMELVTHCEQVGISAMKIGEGFVCLSELLDDISTELNYQCEECISALNPHKLIEIYDVLRLRIVEKAIDNAALILDKTAIYIDIDAEIEEGAIIYPMVTIKGKSVIKSEAIIRSGSVIDNSTIESGADILASFIYDSKIGEKTTVGPCSLIRANSNVGNNVRIGDFVEIKASILEDGVKAAHLTYIGDAEVGEKTNIGCGTVFANYNGKIKQKTIVGKNAFIGSNTNLIAPVKIGNNAYTAAGSTVTEDVPEDTLCIARSRQIIKERKEK